MIEDYTNPNKVFQNAKRIYGNDVQIKLSTRKDKKYMLLNPDTKKWVHFGTMKPPMEDYTKHKDNKRRQLFKIRNQKWAEQDLYSPGFMSYYLTW
jgi:hypothetical protein